MWYVVILLIFFKKCKLLRDWGVKNFMMYLKCGNFFDNILLVFFKSEEVKIYLVFSRILWNLFVFFFWKDVIIYLEILLIIISNIWRMLFYGEVFCFL